MMFKIASTPLFYPTTLSRSELLNLVARVSDDPALDIVDFPDEDGGEADRELAVPFLTGMDEVRVDEAQLQLRVHPKDLNIHSFSVTQISGVNNMGTVLSLAQPSRLRKLFMASQTFLPGSRLIIRPATSENGSFTFGPPIFAAPDFAPPGKLYSRVLSGLSVQDTGKQMVIIFPSLMGSAWLIQLAQGDDPAALTPIPFQADIRVVTIDAAPRNLSIVIVPSEGEPIPLWNHPDYLLPEAGTQEVNFTPIAQNQLSKRLKTASGVTTLPVHLRFHSETGGALEITSRKLSARYLVKPLGPDPFTLRLGGDWASLKLRAPAGLRPSFSSARASVRLLGRELNGGSPLPPLARPSMGLRVNADQWVASPIPFKSPAHTAATQLPLASVRIYLEAPDESEAVVEIRRDVAGAPGPMLFGPLVKQVQKAFSDWLEFEVPAPVNVETGDVPLWAALRSNKGELLWFAMESGAAKVSSDKGQTWGAADPLLIPAATPLAQLFHSLPDPLPAPVIRLQIGDSVITDNLLAHLSQKAPREYVQEVFSLPDSVFDVLRDSAGAERVETELKLFSSAVFDLTLEDMTLFYSPYR
jgi:hypothetical protein